MITIFNRNGSIITGAQSLTVFTLLTLLLSALLLTTSCKKSIAVEPPKTQIVSATVFSNDITAVASVRGIYSEMYRDGYASGSLNGISLVAGLSADEFMLYSNDPDLSQIYSNAILKSNGTITQAFWGAAYKYIYYANSMLEGLSASTAISAPLKIQLQAEAKFIRAFNYFYLVNLFGDVPLVLTTNYKTNAIASRTSINKIFQQIVQDLQDAVQNLQADYSNENGQRIRPNQSTAAALLARVYLYNGDWTNAELWSGKVIGNSLYNLEPDVNSVFLATSTEAIWQLKPVVPNQNTNEATSFIISTGAPALSMMSQLKNDFEKNDKRKGSWVSSSVIGPDTFYFPYKYKAMLSSSVSEYSIVLRLAEQYLIRAEARAKQSNLNGAIADLNAIRLRAGLPAVSTSDQTGLLQFIAHERRIELFSEWGHRWLDLKRTNTADAVLAPVKGSNWQKTDALYPIPASEIVNDPNLVQNPGY